MDEFVSMNEFVSMDEFVSPPTPEQAFAFMLHDRITALEQKIADMDRKPDQRIRFVKKKRFPLLKVHVPDKLDAAVWIEKTVQTIGEKTTGKVFGIACQEYSLATKAYVIESLFDVGDADHDIVATAALEHAPAATLVEVHDVMNSSWFEESIAACSYCLSSYDPDTRATHTTVEHVPLVDERGDRGEDTLWFALNGWLASVVDGVDVHNTRAFDALSAIMKLRQT